MEYNQLLEELKNFESEVVECKESFREDDFGKTMAAFSTKKGGKIFLGVNNNREPVGIIFNQNIKDRISQVARVCEPTVCIDISQVRHDKEKCVVCVRVEKGNGSIYCYKKIPYERREGINHPLSPDEVLEIQKQRKRIYFDSMPSRGEHRPGLISDIDESKVKSYLNRIKGMIREPFNLKQFLINEELLINGSSKIKNVAILLFGKNPSQFIPQNKISVSIFTGDEITNEFIKTEIEGTIEEIFRKTFIEIGRNIKNYSFIRETERIDVPEYPPEAIREVIINSLVHRDYFVDNIETFIKIFKNRIEITNPGGFPFGGYTWEEVEKSGLSIRRNPLIAEFLEKIHLMEKEGHGIKRIKTVLKEHGLPEPKIETTPNTFKVILYGVGDDVKRILSSPFRTVLDSSKLNNRQLKLLSYIKENPGVSRNDCCKELGLAPRTTSRDLKELVQKNFLQPSGLGKGTKYFAR